MQREEFLSKLGIGALAVCMGCSMVSCSKSGTNPSTGGPASGATLSADLSTSLTNVGDAKVSNGIILVRIAAGNAVSSFTAVQVACTHEGNSINYNANQGIFICPAHGSEFSKSGGLIQGPATTSLKQYGITIAGNILTVTV